MPALRFAHLALAGLVVACLCACSVDTIPSPLRATPAGSGPTVVFDLLARPLPDIPTPNDIATFADPTSRTGRRLNASLVAPTRLEKAAREQFDEMEGWGTFAPMTVRFTPEANTPSGQAALDLVDFQSRMDDGWDPSNDPVYLVNLTTGVPVLLDAGGGDFPVTVLDPTLYFPNDPRLGAQNLMYETESEAVGACADGIYRPRCDTDFDGVLDRPNTLGPGAIDGVDNLMTWYERQTDTLILQPMVPLQEKTEYAVILTDRLRAPDGHPVRSPFPGINHPAQTASVARLQGVLGDPTRSNYFGDIAGTGFSHVAFAWTFTTQPVQEDLLLLRNGLYGQGPFASFASDFPTSSIQAFNEVGTTVDPTDEPPGWQMSAQCAKALETPYVVHWADIRSAIAPAIPFLFPLSTSALDAFMKGFDEYVDYLVIGTYDSPYLMGDPASTDPDLHFDVNFQTGQGDVRHTPIPWVAVIPKSNGEHKQPFPVAYWRHGTTLFDLEIAVHAGIYARQGIALVSMDIPGHGLVLSQGDKILLGALLKGVCFGPAATAMTTGRAIDLNGDGVPDSGGRIWSSHLLHTRDGMRQAVLDGIQLNRIFKSWDSKAKSGQDYNHNGDLNDDLAGDFNGDGKVDFGGPDATYSSSGGSLGGLVAEIHGAIDPTFNGGTAPVSGGGGFVHVAVRSKLTPNPVMEEVIGPLIVAVPASSRPATAAGPITKCTGKQMSVRWVVNNLLDSAEVEIACLDPSELASNMTVVVQNYSSRGVHCARTLPGGAFRVPVPATIGDRIHIGIYAGADVIDSYATCNVQGSPALVRTIDTWEQAASVFTEVVDQTDTCASAGGTGTACQQYWSSFYPVGSQLVAPQEGLGYTRQSPDFRKLMNLAQAALDPADPVNFAKLFLLAPAPDWNGKPTGPRPILDVHTVGDYLVPTATGMTFSRAAGLLPFLSPSAADTLPEYADFATPEALYQAWGGRSPDRVMIDEYETEGLARLRRTPLPAGCGVNYVNPTTSSCDSPPPNDAATCAQTLFDGDYLGESMQGIGQAHLLPPMRLARLANKRATASAQLDAVWAPRIQGAPFAADGSWKLGPPVAGMINSYLQPLGDHDWGFGDACQAWDGVSYMDELLARYFATQGQDVYYLTHPTTHECLATQSCAFLPSPP